MDSTKVEIVSKSLDKLVSRLIENTNNQSSIWDTLIPLLIGAGLTLLTHLIIELLRSRREKQKKKQELISKSRAKTYFIAQTLKDLEMYKTHKQYYLRAYEKIEDPAGKEDSFNKHYEKGQEQRVTENKLDENIAEYFQLVTEYIVLTGNRSNFDEQFQEIFHYQHPKSSKFKDCDTQQKLVKGLEKEEKRLNDEYKKFYALFERIQVEMK